MLNCSRSPIMRNSVLHGFRHRRLVSSRLISGLWCYVYNLVHLGGSEGERYEQLCVISVEVMIDRG